MKLRNVLFLSGLLLTINSQSKEISAEMMNYTTIHSMEVSEVTESFSRRSTSPHIDLQRRTLLQEKANTVQNEKSGGLAGVNAELDLAIEALDKVDVIVDKVINIGAKVWKVVEKGRPVINIDKTKNRATAMPENIKSDRQLDNWGNTRSRSYQISYKNLYGIEVVKIVYRISFIAQGSYRGQGHYIGYASVEPMQVKVLYGWNLNMQTNVEEVPYKGSSQDPIARLILHVSWKTNTVLNSDEQLQSYEIDGLGNFSVL